MAYVEIRPVHVTDLLWREGHPLAARVHAARETLTRQVDANPGARRALGIAAGAMIVAGSVVAGVLGLNHGPDSAAPASAGEPVGAAPARGSAQDSAAIPAAATDDGQRPSGRIGEPARVSPPRAEQPAAIAAPAPPAVQAPAPPVIQVPAVPAPPAAKAPSAPAAGPVQSVTEPVAKAANPTLADVVAPVTGTVDDTLQPALTMIGGLLGR